MAQLRNVVDAYPGKTASASNYNKLVDNIEQVHLRIQDIEYQNDIQADRKNNLTDVTDFQLSRLSAIEASPQSHPSQLYGGEWVTSNANVPENIEGVPIAWEWWDTELVTPSGISLASDNRNFTVHQSGTWQIDTTLQIIPYAGGTGFYVWICPGGTHLNGWGRSGGEMRSNNVSISLTLLAGETFNVFFSVAVDGNPVDLAAYDMRPIIHAYRIGA